MYNNLNDYDIVSFRYIAENYKTFFQEEYICVSLPDNKDKNSSAVIK